MAKRPIDCAMGYAQLGLPVFPCHHRGERRKRPMLRHGLWNASTDPDLISNWWAHDPDALIGVPTGAPIGAVVLDIDVRHDCASGYDTLEELGFSILPETPMAHTASGGLHLYFQRPPAGLRNTGGARGRGIGPGLDWRVDGGYVIAPSPGSGYAWDPFWNFGTVHPAPIPPALMPRELAQTGPPMPVRPSIGLSRYAEKALDAACRRIMTAPRGEQEPTLHVECFGIGRLVGAGALPTDFARRVLLWAARQIRDHDPRRPWRAREIDLKITRSFERGMARPRQARHA